MARNKYPEETVKLILDTAGRLFMEKGYDKTSLQDIMNETGLSKGAIYYHFSSKEEILERISRRIGRENAERLGSIRDDKSLNGAEKLRQIFRSAMLHPNQEEILHMVPCLLDNPKMLSVHMRELFELTGPDYIQPILDEGVADGSIKAQNTKELAEMILLMTDIWMNPLVRRTTPEETRRRCETFRILMNGIGLEVLDDDVMEAFVEYSKVLYQAEQALE